MRITYAVEAGGSKPSEDWTGSSENTMVVLDGLTVPLGIQTGCIHGTAWYVSKLGTAILEYSNARPHRPLREVLSASISAVNFRHHGTCDLHAAGTPAATVAIFRASPSGYEYLVLCDAFIVMEMADGGICVYTDRTLDSLTMPERAAVYDLEIGTQEHDEAVLRMVRVQVQLRNCPGGYWVAAADPSAADHAIVGYAKPGDILRAAALTDGAARLAEPFEILSWAELLDLLRSGSGWGLIARTRFVESEDPRGNKWPRYKTSDDAAVVYCDLTENSVRRNSRRASRPSSDQPAGLEPLPQRGKDLD